MDLPSIAEAALRAAKGQGASEADAYVIRYTTRGVYLEDNRPKLAEDKEEVGLGLRFVLGQRVATAATTVRDTADVEAAAARARGIAKVTPEDPTFRGLPEPAVARGTVSGVHDPRIATMTAEDLLDPALAAVDAACALKGHVVSKAVVRAQEYEYVVASTRGVDAGHRGTLVFAAYYSTLEHAKGKGEGIAKAYGTQFGAVSWESLGADLAARAKSTVEAKAHRGSFKGPVIVQAAECGELLMNTVSSALSGEEVVRKRSPWAGKIGAEVAHRTVSFVDRPRMPGGILSASVDEEGVPTEDRALVDDGVLLGYANDARSAAVLHGAAGNGLRRGATTVETSYAIPPQASVSNLTIAPGRGDLDALLGYFDEALLVERFASPSANPVSGGFGLEVRNATFVKDGERARSVKYALLTGNLYEGLKHVLAIGGDVTPSAEQAGGSGIAYVPSVAFEGFALVGMK